MLRYCSCLFAMCVVRGFTLASRFSRRLLLIIFSRPAESSWIIPAFREFTSIPEMSVNAIASSPCFNPSHIPFLYKTLPPTFHFIFTQIFNKFSFLDIQVHAKHWFVHLEIAPREFTRLIRENHRLLRGVPVSAFGTIAISF